MSQRHMAAAVEQQISVSQTSGPIPAASELERYERVLNGAAERILAMAEREAAARQKAALIAAQLASDDAARARHETARGQTFSFLLTLAAFGVAVYCAARGATAIGVTVAGATLASIVSTLVNRRR